MNYTENITIKRQLNCIEIRGFRVEYFDYIGICCLLNTIDKTYLTRNPTSHIQSLMFST